jgi:hypothetical protein
MNKVIEADSVYSVSGGEKYSKTAIPNGKEYYGIHG